MTFDYVSARQTAIDMIAFFGGDAVLVKPGKAIGKGPNPTFTAVQTFAIKCAKISKPGLQSTFDDRIGADAVNSAAQDSLLVSADGLPVEDGVPLGPERGDRILIGRTLADGPFEEGIFEEDVMESKATRSRLVKDSYPLEPAGPTSLVLWTVVLVP